MEITLNLYVVSAKVHLLEIRLKFVILKKRIVAIKFQELHNLYYASNILSYALPHPRAETAVRRILSTPFTTCKREERYYNIYKSFHSFDSLKSYTHTCACNTRSATAKLKISVDLLANRETHPSGIVEEETLLYKTKRGHCAKTQR